MENQLTEVESIVVRIIGKDSPSIRGIATDNYGEEKLEEPDGPQLSTPKKTLAEMWDESPNAKKARVAPKPQPTPVPPASTKPIRVEEVCQIIYDNSF